METQHLEVFQKMAAPGQWDGAAIYDWVSAFAPEYAAGLPSVPLKRSELRTLCCSDISTMAKFWSVMAWGKMRPINAMRFADRAHFLEPVLDELRSGVRNRVECFRALQNAIEDFQLSGLGPAFFTKVIFFMRPQCDGYIMDQWAARSVNFLADREVVKLDGGRYVSKRNAAENYGNYCQFIESLVPLVSDHGKAVNPEWVEMALFSKGGREPSPWRLYLIREGG